MRRTETELGNVKYICIQFISTVKNMHRFIWSFSSVCWSVRWTLCMWVKGTRLFIQINAGFRGAGVLIKQVQVSVTQNNAHNIRLVFYISSRMFDPFTMHLSNMRGWWYTNSVIHILKGLKLVSIELVRSFYLIYVILYKKLHKHVLLYSLQTYSILNYVKRGIMCPL